MWNQCFVTSIYVHYDKHVYVFFVSQFNNIFVFFFYLSISLSLALFLIRSLSLRLSKIIGNLFIYQYEIKIRFLFWWFYAEIWVTNWFICLRGAGGGVRKTVHSKCLTLIIISLHSCFYLFFFFVCIPRNFRSQIYWIHL